MPPTRFARKSEYPPKKRIQLLLATQIHARVVEKYISEYYGLEGNGDDTTAHPLEMARVALTHDDMH